MPFEVFPPQARRPCPCLPDHQGVHNRTSADEQLGPADSQRLNHGPIRRRPRAPLLAGALRPRLWSGDRSWLGSGVALALGACCSAVSLLPGRAVLAETLSPPPPATGAAPLTTAQANQDKAHPAASTPKPQAKANQPEAIDNGGLLPPPCPLIVPPQVPALQPIRIQPSQVAAKNRMGCLSAADAFYGPDGCPLRLCPASSGAFPAGKPR